MRILAYILIVLGSIWTSLMVYSAFVDIGIPPKFSILSGLLSLFIVCGSFVFLTFRLSPERRKRITRRALISSIVLIVLGLIGTRMRWPGARMEIMLGVFIFSFYYGPLSLKQKYDKWKIYTDSRRDALLLSTFDFVGFGCLFTGQMFKLQMWPGADGLTVIGIIVLLVGIVAWNYKFKKEVVRRKDAEDQLKVQHEQLEEKQKEILDSIRYAKRIQQSNMPTEKYIEQSLKRLNK